MKKLLPMLLALISLNVAAQNDTAKFELDSFSFQHYDTLKYDNIYYAVFDYQYSDGYSVARLSDSTTLVTVNDYYDFAVFIDHHEGYIKRGVNFVFHFDVPKKLIIEYINQK